jgi:exonuclease III
MEYGVMNKIEITWGGKKMEIISTYRPYPNKAKGSLREAMPKVGGEFEERYWDIIRKSTEGKKLVVGGDFNLNKSLMKVKSKELNIKLCELEDGEVTYKSEIGQEHTGACIDHVLTKG